MAITSYSPPKVSSLELVNLAIKFGADIKEVDINLNLEINNEYLLDYIKLGLNPIGYLQTIVWEERQSSSLPSAKLSKLFSDILDITVPEAIKVRELFNFITFKKFAPEKMSHYILKLLESPFDANTEFLNFLKMSTSSDSERGLIPLEVLKIINDRVSIKPDYILEYAIARNALEVVEYALGLEGVNVNAKAYYYESTMLEQAVGSSNYNYAIIKLLLDAGATREISLSNFINNLYRSSVSHMAEIIKDFPDIYNEQKNNELLKSANELLKSLGTSPSLIKIINDKYNISFDYLRGNLNPDEILLLSEKDSSMESINFEISNKYGYKPLHLALLAHKYDLAIELINEGTYNINDRLANEYGPTPFEIICFVTSDFSSIDVKMEQKLLQATLEKVSDVDSRVDDIGGTLADILLSGHDANLKNKVLELSKDPLFELMKNGDNFLLKADNITHIAISNCHGLWSEGIWAAARLIMDKHPSVKFHLISQSDLEKNAKGFLQKFDAVINPGGSDNYPQGLLEFSKSNCTSPSNLEKMWQQIAELSNKLDIPYLGICAGAQHLALHHGGTLAPLDGYNQGQHDIKFIKGTLAYFLAMTDAQRAAAFCSFNFPDINLKGDTAHHYAAKNLGIELIQGALSEDNISMAYSHHNGIRFGVQFHPEHYYGKKGYENETAWFDNFIKIAIDHHAARNTSNIKICSSEDNLAMAYKAFEYVNKLNDKALDLAFTVYDYLDELNDYAVQAVGQEHDGGY